MDGWITIHRRLLDSPLWIDETFTRGQAWVDLIGLANYKPGFIRVRGNRINVERGQCGWSIKRLSERWRWSQGKVKRFFNELENDEQIEQQNSFLSSLITIINYEEYQKVDSKAESRRGADGEQTETKNKGNKGNNSKKLTQKENLKPDTRQDKIKKTIEQYKLWREESKWDLYRAFINWMLNEKLEACFALNDQFSEQKFRDLMKRHNAKSDLIKNKISAMENSTGLEKNNKSFSRTLNGWIARETNR